MRFAVAFKNALCSRVQNALRCRVQNGADAVAFTVSWSLLAFTPAFASERLDKTATSARPDEAAAIAKIKNLGAR